MTTAAKTAKRLAQGDLSMDIHVDSTDEAGQMLQSLKDVVESNRGMAAVAGSIAKGDLLISVEERSADDTLGLALKEMLGRLKEVIQNVRMASGNVTSGSQAMSAASQQMSQGATEQAASAEEASASVEEMTANIRQNADNAQQTEGIALKAANDAEEGGAAVTSS